MTRIEELKVQASTSKAIMQPRRTAVRRWRTALAMLLIAGLATAWGQLALAEADVAEAGEALVNDFLSDVVTMQGRFEQSLVDADGQVVEISGGTLEIERPGRFRWAYADPYEQWLVADGQNVWSYDVDLAQVTVKPQEKALSNTPAMLLGGSASVLEQFRIEGTRIENVTTWVRMRPVDNSSGFNRVELGFLDGQLTRMVFYDNLEQTTLVALYDLVVNEPIDASRFEFVVPDDVDLVGVPLAKSDAIP
ncbi:MAG: outer membrane lipoprotein chaperone LolA [Gammaproteobacteria bacterium]|nr:outer membrane lipoprotein chaperone LolA [Gammaproteobacteria bacterium]